MKKTLLFTSTLLAQYVLAGDRPNVLIIMCDDMGYGDLGCYGQKYISTPNIDSLASTGIKFTQAYAGSPVSAPSRASLMTGQHTGRCEVRGNKEYWPNSPIVKYGDNDEYTVVGQHPYDPNHIILPEIMKLNGYNTGMFGKWAGGYEGSVSTPDKRGIDDFYGYICQFQAHLYYPNFLNRYSPAEGDTATVRVTLEENIKYPMFGDDYFKRSQYSADLIHQKALEWINRQDNETPFMGLLTYTLPHAELAQPEDSLLQHYREKFTDDKTWKGEKWSRYNPVKNTHTQFAAMITRLDSYVGEIETTLREKGLDQNTIIIFTSDNGPHEEGGADPDFFGRDGKLRGLKRSVHEGGIRIPFIVKWPQKIAQGTESDQIIAFYDILPTLCDLIGQDINKLPTDASEFDGISFAPTITKEGEQTQHEYLYWEFDETDQIGVRKGDWKLIVKKGVPELYNLNDDLHEDHNIAAEHPEIVDELIQIVLQAHTPNPHFSVTLPLSTEK